MKETYIQQVKQELSLPKKKKEAIARNSRAAFRNSSVPTLRVDRNGAIGYPSPCPLSLASHYCCWESRRA